MSEIQIHLDPPRPDPVIVRFWCGRCHSEVSGPTAPCPVCTASAYEVARHHRATFQERRQ